MNGNQSEMINHRSDVFADDASITIMSMSYVSPLSISKQDTDAESEMDTL